MDVFEQDSLERAKHACKLINSVVKAVFAIFCLYWSITAALIIFPLVNPSLSTVAGVVSPITIVAYIAQGLLIATILLTVIKIFGIAAKGQSPFKIEQVKRLRVIALLLIAYAIVDSIVASNTAWVQFGGLDYGYMSTASENAIIAVNFAPIVTAAVVFAFSFVFKYGVLLQEFSDETL